MTFKLKTDSKTNPSPPYFWPGQGSYGCSKTKFGWGFNVKSFQENLAEKETAVYDTGKKDLEKKENILESGVWEPHRKLSSVEQSTFTVERKLNVEIDMNGEEGKKEWSIHYVDEVDNTEKKDVGKEKLES